MDKFTITYLPVGVTDPMARIAYRQAHYTATSMDRAVAQFREDMEGCTPVHAALTPKRPTEVPSLEYDAEETQPEAPKAGELTSEEVASLAARLLRNPDRATPEEVQALAGSCLTQRG